MRCSFISTVYLQAMPMYYTVGKAVVLTVKEWFTYPQHVSNHVVLLKEHRSVIPACTNVGSHL